MVQRAEIEHRYSTFEPGETPTIAADRDGFYRLGHFASERQLPKLYVVGSIPIAHSIHKPC